MASINNELALFQPMPHEVAVDEVKWVNIRPTMQISDTGPIEFNISPTSSYYVLLSKTFLQLKVRITHTDDSPLVKDEEVSLTNLPLSSCFRQCDVALNQQIINPSVGTNYPYKAYLDVLLNYNHDVKDGLLQCEGYYKDTPFRFDSYLNGGHTWRQQLTKNSIIADFEGVLHTDLAQQDRAILNNVAINIKLWQSSDEFRIFSAQEENGTTKTNYKLEIVDAALKVCYLSLNPSTIVAQNNRLSKQVAQYPYWKSVVKSYGIPQGSYGFSFEDIFSAELPCQLIVGFVRSRKYTGEMKSNPFDFEHSFLNFLEFTADSVSVPGTPYTPKYVLDPDLTDPQKTYITGYVREYQSIFSTDYPQKSGNYINRSDYPGGYALYLFDIKPGTNKHLYSKTLKGHSRLSGRFDKALDEPLVAIVYGKFPAEFSIDQSRLVTQ